MTYGQSVNRPERESHHSGRRAIERGQANWTRSGYLHTALRRMRTSNFMERGVQQELRRLASAVLVEIDDINGPSTLRGYIK